MKKLKKLEELIEINSLVSSQLDYNDILQSISLSALALLNCDSAEIWASAGRHSAKESTFELLQSGGASDKDSIRTPRLKLDVSMENAGEISPTKLKAALKKGLPFPGYKPVRLSAIGFEIGEHRSGLFTVSRESNLPFGDEDRYFLNQLSRQASISLQNSEKFQALQKARDQALAENKLLKVGKEFIGKSRVTTELITLVDQVAPSMASVLILGERGVGKEIIADMLHSQSKRHDAPFIKINCGGIVESLLESELFGHEKGSFTGADKQKKGLLEEAHGGAILLDEIADMPEAMQVKLLRFLQQGTLRRVGGNKDISVDVRVIGATNKKIDDGADMPGFRRDLFDRLATVILRIPPLRQRPQDIIHLMHYFLQKYSLLETKPFISGFSPELTRQMENYAWPGNVRELENAIHRLIILHQEGPIIRSDFAPYSSAAAATLEQTDAAAPTPALPFKYTQDDFPALREARNAFEETYIRTALRLRAGNISQASKLAGIDRGNFKIKMRKYNIKL